MARLPCVGLLLAGLVVPAHGLADDDSGPRRHGDNGAPPGAFDDPASEPASVGWRVDYATDGSPQAWHRGDLGTDTLELVLSIDRDAPSATLDVRGPQSTCGAQLCIAPTSELHAAGSDASGVAALQIVVDGEALPAGRTQLDERADGTYRVAVLASDRLGNQAELASRDVRLDSQPPTLRWQRRDPIDGVPDDVFDGRRAQLTIVVDDAGAGVASLRLGERDIAVDPSLATGIDLDVDAAALDYTLLDRVGNRADGRIELRSDDSGPSLIAQVNGQAIDLQTARVLRSDRLQLHAEDALAGVAQACVEASIWYGRCRELPIDLIGIAPGRYPVEFRAVDRLGNRSFQRLTMEVLP